MKDFIIKTSAFIALFIFVVGVLFLCVDCVEYISLVQINSILLITTFAFIGIKFITE